MGKMHEYPVSLDWKGGRGGSGQVTATRTDTKLSLCVPPEFGGGESGGTNPEELLTSAVTACYSITFGIIAENRKLPVQNFHVEAVGEVEENGAMLTYTKITVKPVITLEAGSSEEQVKMAEDMAHKADSYCIITNAIRGKVEIAVEPQVTTA